MTNGRTLTAQCVIAYPKVKNVSRVIRFLRSGLPESGPRLLFLHDFFSPARMACLLASLLASLVRPPACSYSPVSLTSCRHRAPITIVIVICLAESPAAAGVAGYT